MRRAEGLAKIAKCPTQRVMTVAFNQLPPFLLEKISGIQDGDVPEDRNHDTAGRMDSSLSFPAETADFLKECLDPAGLTGLAQHFEQMVACRVFSIFRNLSAGERLLTFSSAA